MYVKHTFKIVCLYVGGHWINQANLGWKLGPDTDWAM